METLKIAFIGAASPQWGHTISRDLIVMLSEPRVCDAFRPILMLEDVDGVNLELQRQLAAKVAGMTGNRVEVAATTDQARAVEGARFVVNSIAQGTLEAMLIDLEIAQEYGVYMPVGDTISIGGAIRAARNIPALLSIARDLERLGHAEAWLLNLSNPMSILCRAVTRETRVRTIGCCHEMYGGVGSLLATLGHDRKLWRDRQRCQIEVLGVNHCAWLTRLTVDGEDQLARFRAYLDERGITLASRRLYDSPHPELRKRNVKIHLFLRHGVLPYSGDRHNVEFFQEFCNRETNKGADWGVLLTTGQERLVEWRGGARESFSRKLNGREDISLERSQEASSRIIPALLFGDELYDVGNLPYQGRSLPGVPQGAVIERMTIYDRQGAHPLKVSPLPAPLQEYMNLHLRNIEDIVQACVDGDRKRFIRALRRDPLMQNAPSRKIPEMVDRLLEAHRPMVHPGFFS